MGCLTDVQVQPTHSRQNNKMTGTANVMTPHLRHLLNAFGLPLHSILDDIIHSYATLQSSFQCEYDLYNTTSKYRYSTQMSAGICDNLSEI
jgi:hypothetical protein